MTAGLQVPTQPLVERQHTWICEQGGALCAHRAQAIEDVIHELLTEACPLIQGMNGHIPDGGLKHPITSAAGKSNQSGNPRVMTPQTNPQKAVIKGLANPAHRPTAPTHRFQKLLQLHEIERPVLTEHQSQLLVGRRAQLGLFAIHGLQSFWRERGTADHLQVLLWCDLDAPEAEKTAGWSRL